MKKCPTCKITQPKNEFNKHKGTKDGLYPKCKSCRKKEREQPENKKKHSERNKKWYLNNFKKIKKSLRKNSLKTLYNITIEDYNKMLKKTKWKMCNL